MVLEEDGRYWHQGSGKELKKKKAEAGEAASVQRTFMRTEHPEGILLSLESGGNEVKVLLNNRFEPKLLYKLTSDGNSSFLCICKVAQWCPTL